MTRLASAVKPLDEGCGVFVGHTARRTGSLRAECGCPATYALTYTEPFGCVRLSAAYEATKVSPLQVVQCSSLPERSAPPLRELQPYLYPAAHEETSRAQGDG